jgi:adenylate cyclase
MAQEIERKFLVIGDFEQGVKRRARIVQGYLSSVPERTVRVRIKGEEGFLTIKGIGNESGASRYEWERPIPLAEAEELLRLCEPGVIDKTRCLVEAGPHTYEVDVFHGENEGLVVAEIELSDEDEAFERPDWLGEEVTGDVRYYNAMLMKTPYSRW